jgi:hypothetical protein
VEVFRKAYSAMIRFLSLAQNQLDARFVVRMADQIVNGGEVEVHLPGVLRLERRHL